MVVAQGSPDDVIWLIGAIIVAPILLVIAILVWFLFRRMKGKL